MSAHSPAPWRWRAGSLPAEYEIQHEGAQLPPELDWRTWRSLGYFDNPRLVDAGGEDVVSAGAGEYTPVHGRTPEQRAANAWLLAAAPKMLAALKRIVLLNDLMPEDHPGRLSHGEYEQACATIAEAEGKS